MTTVSGTLTPYRLLLNSVFNKEADLNSDTIKVSQHKVAYTPNLDTHQYWDVSVNNECSGSGYSAGGATCAGSFSYSSGTKILTLDLADIAPGSGAWASCLVTDCRYLTVYDNTPSSNKPLIALVDLLAPSQVTAVTWNVNGIISWQFP